MKRKILTSIVASTVLVGTMALTGCGGSSTPKDGNTTGNNPGGSTGNSRSGMINIATATGSVVSVDPSIGGTVIIESSNSSTESTNSTNSVATVVTSSLNDCANATSDADGDGVICGPKAGVTYVFQSDFGKLGPIDNNKSTPDGGALLYDARTYFGGALHQGPIEGNKAENRIQKVYIPTNYIKLTDALKGASVDQQYAAMRNYLANICNMQSMSNENESNPFFDTNTSSPTHKTEGKFVATYVMHFTRGTGEKALMEKFKTNKTDLEYLAVSFELDVKEVDGNSSKLQFTSPVGSKVTFYGKKHGEGALIAETDNDVINSVLHTSHKYVDSGFTINMAKYFDKLIAKGNALGLADYAKEILVENAQHPWPVKIYGTLHEINADGTYDRSFVRNPAKLDAALFGLTQGGTYKDAFINDAAHMYERGYAQAMKFAIVYPGGNYNKLED